jgi:hypothetical protein
MIKRVVHMCDTKSQAEEYIAKKDIADQAIIRERRITDRNSRKQWTYSVYCVLVPVDLYNEITHPWG